jgi:hypothetical protein
MRDDPFRGRIYFEEGGRTKEEGEMICGMRNDKRAADWLLFLWFWEIVMM